MENPSQNASEERDALWVKEDLERRVIDRTMALQQLNDQLKNEIQERKSIEQQLLHSQKMEAIGLLAGGIAHDFNNILTVIIGCSEILYKKNKEIPSVEKMASQILKAGQDAASLTSQLLMLGRKQKPKLEVFDLNKLVADMGEIFNRVIGENIKFFTCLNNSEDTVEFDVGQLKQVVLNLVVNSRDAIVDRGEVRLTISRCRVDTLFFINQASVAVGDYVCLTVTDTGRGINAENIERIYEPFFTTKEFGKGTGLGLSIVFGILESHNSYITVSSEKDKGSVFKLYIPRVEKEISTISKKEVVNVQGGKETVLIVEDQKSLLDFCKELLENEGYHVLLASSGEEALDISGKYKKPIDIVLSDIVMTGINGVEMWERMKAVRKEAKVIFMSGYTADVAQDKLSKEGSIFLSKPFTNLQMLQSIRSVSSQN